MFLASARVGFSFVLVHYNTYIFFQDCHPLGVRCEILVFANSPHWVRLVRRISPTAGARILHSSSCDICSCSCRESMIFSIPFRYSENNSGISVKGYLGIGDGSPYIPRPFCFMGIIIRNVFLY